MTGGKEGVVTDDRATLAVLIDRLLETVHPAGRGPYTYEEVADGIRAAGGPTISAQYLNQLHRGRRDNPTKQHLEALAAFFGVPVAYFFDEQQAELVDEEIALLKVIRDAEVKDLALRTLELGPEARRSVAAVIEELGRFEKRTGHSNRRR